VKSLVIKILAFVIFILNSGFAADTGRNGVVYKAKIEGMIDLGLAPYVRRVVNEAGAQNAAAIIFEINTFGGRVDAATQIKDAILNSKVLTIAFVNKRAISAGALITLSCEKIVMAPGSSIGATSVVDQTGKKMSEKAQSYMRAEMRATAEKRGRRKDIAEAMVDERVMIEGLVDSTQLLTLTAEEALKYGIADTVLENTESILAAFNLNGAQIKTVDSNWAEDFVRFLNNPVVSSLLIMIGLVGLFAEIKTPGWGLPGTAALIALTLFFGSGYILELASVIEILIFVAGVILLLIEIFVIPGFGIFGVLGIIMIMAGLFLGLISDFPMVEPDLLSTAIIQLASAFVLGIAVIAVLLKFLPKTGMWKNLILDKNISAQSGYTSYENFNELIGKEGKALTVLRPAGTALIDGKRLDVVTPGDFINKGTKIKVIEVEGSKIVVEKIK